MLKLLNLKITNHHFFNSLSLDFVNEGEYNGPYVTLMIGPNGTGKSQILSIIIEVFNFVAASKIRDKVSHKFDYHFEIKYSISNITYEIKHNGFRTEYFLNDKAIVVKDVVIPNKFIASAINLTDRYPNLTRNSKLFNTKYQYLGVRSASNNAFISNHLKSIVDSLSEAISKKKNITQLKFLFEQLNLVPSISISYKAGYRFSPNMFAGDKVEPSVISNNLKTFFETYILTQKKANRKSYRLEKYERILKENTKQIEIAAKFLFDNKNKFIGITKSKVKYESQLKFDSKQSVEEFTSEVIALKTLIDLEILSYDKINLHKVKSKFQFIQASSGEYHLLTSLLGIFSRIENSSLILIDEPEISLHPNWQMKYMNVLTKVFENDKTCHFLIASHSHFLVSDLQNNSSAILSLNYKEDESKIVSKLLDLDTFGWTPENILYNIFDVATVRNHFFEMDLRNLLKLLSDKSKDKTLIQKYLSKFVSLELVENDPLELIIDQAKKYLANEF